MQFCVKNWGDYYITYFMMGNRAQNDLGKSDVESKEKPLTHFIDFCLHFRQLMNSVTSYLRLYWQSLSILKWWMVMYIMEYRSLHSTAHHGSEVYTTVSLNGFNIISSNLLIVQVCVWEYLSMFCPDGTLLRHARVNSEPKFS